MTKKIQAVVFDLYGTLIYLTHETKPYMNLFVELGLQTPEEFRQARRIALTEDFENLAGLVGRIKPDANIDVTPYEEEVAREIASATVYPETRNALETLRQRDIKIGLISNLSSPYKKPFFDLKLQSYFDHFLFSCEVGIHKPDERIYRRILQDMHVNPSYALMVGDKKHCDVDPPTLLGMHAVLLDRNNQSTSQTKIVTLEGIFQYC